MSEISKFINHKEDGKRLILHNKNYEAIANIMSDKKFITFFDTYFNSMNDTETIILFLSMYRYVQRNNPKFSKEEIISVIHSNINNPVTRQKICQQMLNWSKNPKLAIQ